MLTPHPLASSIAGKWEMGNEKYENGNGNGNENENGCAADTKVAQLRL